MALIHLVTVFIKSCKVPGHQSEMSNSVKLFPRDAKEQKFEIDIFLKGID